MTEGSFQSHRPSGRPTVGLVLTGGPDIDPVFLNDIGQATMTSTRTYAVHEIRSVLQP